MDTPTDLVSLIGPLAAVAPNFNRALTDRSGAIAAWSGFVDDHDDYAPSAADAGTTLIADFGQWPHWEYRGRLVGDENLSLITEYCEGDVYVYLFATPDDAAKHLSADATVTAE